MQVGNRIVCAANYYPDGDLLILGVRHYDDLMGKTMQNLGRHVHIGKAQMQQGFVDRFGVFQSRTAAWKIAKEAGQIIRRCGGDTANGGTLYSENLY